MLTSKRANGQKFQILLIVFDNKICLLDLFMGLILSSLNSLKLIWRNITDANQIYKRNLR